MKTVTFILATTTSINTCGLIYLLFDKIDFFYFSKIGIEQEVKVPEVESASTLLSSNNFFFIASKVFFGITKLSTIISQGGLSTTVVGVGSIIFLYKYSDSIFNLCTFPNLLRQYPNSQLTLRDTTNTISNDISSLVNSLLRNANKGSGVQQNHHTTIGDLITNVSSLQNELNETKRTVNEQRCISQVASQSIAALEENVKSLIDVYFNSR